MSFLFPDSTLGSDWVRQVATLGTQTLLPVTTKKPPRAIIDIPPPSNRNTQGTSAYQPRVHKFQITFAPTLTTTPSPPNLKFNYLDTILFTDPSGNPISGLDPTTTLPFTGFANLPASKFTGDGFGGSGSGGTRVSLDPEALVLGNDGFWIGDEYGPFIYHFDLSGKMNIAIKPPASIVPVRDGGEKCVPISHTKLCTKKSFSTDHDQLRIR